MKFKTLCYPVFERNKNTALPSSFFFSNYFDSFNASIVEYKNTRIQEYKNTKLNGPNPVAGRLGLLYTD